MKWYVTKRGKKYTAIVELGKDPLTGKRKQKWLSGFETKNEADIGAVEFIKKFQSGMLADSKNATFDDLLKYWLKQKVEPGSAPTTYSSYKIMVDKHISPVLGHVKLDKLRKGDIQAFINSMWKKDYSHRTMEYCHDIINIALNYAVDENFIEQNPCRKITIPENVSVDATIKTFSAKEVEILLKNTKGKPIHMPVLLAVTCGLRRGEILALRWDDINFASKTIRITKSRVRGVDSKILEKKPKTDSSIRTVAVPEVTLYELKQEKGNQEQNKKDLGVEYEDQGYIVCWDDGRPFKPDYVTKAFRKAIKRLGLPKITFHDLRHTHATLLLEQGVHPKIVQERLGHSTISMTLDTYSHVLPNIQQEAADKMDDIFD